MIASELLRRDLTAVNAAVSNSNRAVELIATADSSLGEVSKLLLDIRGLVTEAPNQGALSNEQIDANQLQIDSSLEAIDRISQTTTFQGRKLLDGTLDFVTSGGANFNKLSGLSIQQTTLGTSGSLDVSINIATAATQAQVDLTNIPTSTAAANAQQSFSFSHAITQATSGVITLTSTGRTVTINAVAGEVF